MTALFQIAVINAVTVLPLTVLAFVISRAARRPALTHALWVLVLLKFVTPPLFHLPVTIETPNVATVGHASNVPVPFLDVSVGNTATEITASVARTESSKGVAGSLAEDSNVAETHALRHTSGRATQVTSPDSRATQSFFTSTLQTCSTFWAQRPDVRSMLLTGWLVGVALWMTLQIVRTVRFQRRVLRGAVPSIELQRQTEQLGTALNLRSVPRVQIVEATVSAMLWGCGSRARLLFPSELAERLDSDARATLLTHELAHFARGDHWVRLLELIATGLFWWHPVVWWARHKIEESEEECCDAWVVGQFPDTPRRYAEALLDTIDFLCESRQALPPVACGLGQAHFLRHRLTKIMHGAAPEALSRRLRCGIAMIAALLLPLQPFVFGSASAISSRMEAEAQTTERQRSEVRATEVRGQSGETDPLDVPPPANGSTEKVSTSSAPSRLRGEKTWSTAASADGRFVVRATTARRVVLTDRVTNSETDLSAHGITAIAFVPGQPAFVAAASDGRVTLWDAEAAQPTRDLLAHTDAWRSVSVSPSGDVVAVGGKSGSVLMLDIATGSTLKELARQAMAVNSVRFSPDASRLAVAIGDWESNAGGRVVLFDAESGASNSVLDCESAPGAVSFASNGELIIGLWNGQADLWNLESGRRVGSAQADKSVVAAAAFSPDNPALREVDFVATRPVAAEDKSDNPLLDFFFGGRLP